MEWKIKSLSEAGLSDDVIERFFASLESKKINLDSFLMVKKGNIIFERYWEQYSVDALHLMYSTAKSFTAIAIGCLIQENKLSLQDKICDYFKDKLPSNGVHPYIGEITLWNLLTMTTAHKTTTYKRYHGDWVESFFHVKPAYHPGTIFSYDTSAPHVMSALVARVTGMDLFEYLKNKVLDEIGFSKYSYWEKDDAGVTKGGEALYCTTRDLASVALLCMNYGIYQGKQLISEAYLRDMTRVQVSTKHKEIRELQFGYGYQIWINRYGGFTFYGKGGQMAVCYPDKDFMWVTTAGMEDREQDLQVLYDMFYEVIYPCLS